MEGNLFPPCPSYGKVPNAVPMPTVARGRSLHVAHGNGSCCAWQVKGQENAQGPSNEYLWAPLGKQNDSNAPQPTNGTFNPKPFSCVVAAKLVLIRYEYLSKFHSSLA